MNRMFFVLRQRVAFGAALISFVGMMSVAHAQAPSKLNIELRGSHEPAIAGLSFGDVWAEGDIACLGIWLGYGTSYGVGIYSITNPASPQLLSIYSPSPGSQNQFELGALRNRIGYFGSWSGGGVHIVSLTNPAAPVRLSRIGATTGDVINGFDRVHTLFLERDYLYLAAHLSGITTVKVFDISNPHLPVFLQNIQTTNTTKVHQITVGNKGASTILYTSGWGGNSEGNPSSYGQTDIWDVTNVGSQPAQWLGRIYSGYNSHSSWPTPDGNTLIVCRETSGGDVRFYDITTPPQPSADPTANPPPLVTISPASMGIEADIPHNPVVIGNLLFLSWYQNGVQVFDITDRTKPVRIGFYDTYPAARSSSFQGNWGVFPDLGLDRLLLSDIQSGLIILDASALLTPTNNYPPLLVQSPASLIVTQGMSAAFTPIITGGLMNYQWRFNGANIPGANSTNLVINPVQPADAGSYSVIAFNASGSVTSQVANLTVIIPQIGDTVFHDNLDAVSSSTNWMVFEGSANATEDYTVDWAFDYSTYFSAFNGATIPPAPGTTNGTTRGVKLTVNNNDGTGALAGVSLYPKNLFMSGAYRLKFDMWMNYPGGASGAGGSGQTETATFGLNHSGSRVNWYHSSASPSDGVWFGVTGEGGDNPDYQAYVGNAGGSPTRLSFSASGVGASGASSASSSASYFQSIFPAPPYETAGAPGKKWVEVEVSQDTNNVITWRMNGNLIAQRTNTSSFTAGTVMIGYMDLFSSLANPPEDAFVIFDNISVESIGVPTPPEITAHPENVAVYPGQDASFTVAVTGSGPLSYQWRFNGNNIPGATNSSLDLFSIEADAVGYYSVRVDNAHGSVVSAEAALTLLDSPYINAVQASPGARSALITWNTTIPANSQVHFDPATVVLPDQVSAQSAQGGFTSTSYIDPTLTTNHAILLTGLMPDTLYSYQVISTEGTNTYISGVYQFTTAGTIILDNPDAFYAGTWTFNATLSNDRYLSNYNYATTVTGSATATATYTPHITTPGKYDVYVWYPQGANRPPDAHHTITHNGSSETVFVDQTINGGSWQLIAANKEFAKGTNGHVIIANTSSIAGRVVMADGVRLVYVEDQEFGTGQTVPAWWSDFYFGGPADPQIDHDNDGYTTGQEYVIGTSPVDPDSRLELDGQTENNSLQMSFWPYLGNRNYELHYRAEIGAPGWQVVSPGTITPSPDGRGTFTLSLTNAPRNFYRLRVEMNSESAFKGSLAVPEGKSYSPFATEPFCGPNRAYIVN